MSIWYDRSRKHWAYKFQYQGKKYRGRGHRTKGQARIAQEEHRKEVRQKIPKTRTGTAFSEVANLYLDYCSRKFTDKTYQGKALAYKEFIAHQGDPPLDQITPEILHSYLNSRPTNNNYNKRRKDLSALFTYVRQQLKIPIPHPMWDLPKMPHRVRKPTPPNEQQILQLIMAADPKKDERQLLLVLVHTLARIDEILRLTWEDVNFEQRWIRLWTRKREDGSWESDELHMNEDVRQVLKYLWYKRTRSTFVFVNPRTGDRYLRRPKLMLTICMRAFQPGLKKKDVEKYTGPRFGFHDIRRGVATLLQDKEKVGTKTVSGILRHKKVSTTERYLFTSSPDQVAALEKLEGKFVGVDLGVDPAKNPPPKPPPAENEPRKNALDKGI